MKSTSSAYAWILLLLFTSSFAGEMPAPRLPASAIPVPLVRQATSYSCGAAALLGVLFYWQKADEGESELYARLGTTPQEGTRSDKIAEVAHSYGLAIQLREHLGIGDLQKYLTQRIPVILNMQAWHSATTPKVPYRDDYEDGHFLVLVAMDEYYAYFMDPSASAGYGFMPLTELDDRWHDVDNIDGKPVKTDHLGIAVRGDNPVPRIPGPLVRID